MDLCFKEDMLAIELTVAADSVCHMIMFLQILMVRDKGNHAEK